MEAEKIEKIKKSLLFNGARDIGMLEDAFSLCVESGDHVSGREIRDKSLALVRDGTGGARALDLYWKTMLFDAPEDFDAFMLYLEHQRPFEQQYWFPRRNKLMPLCRTLQDMEDGKLDELFLSMPPRTGKSTLMVMFLAWIMGRDSERSNLYVSYTESVAVMFYKGVLEVLQDPVTYAYYDIFPERKLVSTDAKNLLINMDRRKRYPSVTSRSLYGTLNGACDCSGYQIGDDLISGYEEAINKDRLLSAWNVINNNMIPRAKESARHIWMGTRWSLIDPQGIRMDILQNDARFSERRWKVINIPALDEKDESNFAYDYNAGFSTEFYHQRRAGFERNGDMASWLAQYQGEPIERDGAVFSPDELRYYNGELPDGMPDRVFMAIDPSWGGGDYCAATVVSQYGSDLYLQDVVFDDGDKRVTQPKIVNAAKKYGVTAIKCEGTKMTADFGEAIDQKLRADGIRVNMQINTSHFTGTGKRDRILGMAPDIREKMLFLGEGHRSKEYSAFMQNLFSFTATGKAAKHDDAPDVLAMTMQFATSGVSKVEVIQRFW